MYIKKRTVDLIVCVCKLCKYKFKIKRKTNNCSVAIPCLVQNETVAYTLIIMAVVLELKRSYYGFEKCLILF